MGAVLLTGAVTTTTAGADIEYLIKLTENQQTLYLQDARAEAGDIYSDRVDIVLLTTGQLNGHATSKLNDASILYDEEDSVYKMWALASTGPNGYWSIYYVVSQDMVNWSIQEVLYGTSDQYDADRPFQLTALKESNTNYKMWYSVYHAGDSPYGYRWSLFIHYRNSSDGISWGAEQTTHDPGGLSDDYISAALHLQDGSLDRLYYTYTYSDLNPLLPYRMDVAQDGVTESNIVQISSTWGWVGAATIIGSQTGDNHHRLWTTDSQVLLRYDSFDEGQTWAVTNMGNVNSGCNYMFWIVGGLVFNGVWAQQWNPDTDPNLKFNLNFENNPGATTTIDAVSGLVGTLVNFNPPANVWQPMGIIGTSADFGQGNDQGIGALNDCWASVDPAGSTVLNFGSATQIRTWAFWFNDVDFDDLGVPLPILVESTFLRHQNIFDNRVFWDMYIKNTRLGFRTNKPDFKMQFETVDSVAGLGVTPSTWHHIVFVIDRTTQDSSKIYVDGLSVPIVFNAFFPADETKSGNVNDMENSCPLSVGANGTVTLPWSIEGEFDGMLDEVRVYHKALTPVEVSVLYQTDYTVKPIALLPIPSSDEVSIAVDLEWMPAAGLLRNKCLSA